MPTPHGVPFTYPRERLVRRGHGTWTGRIHEFQIIRGRIGEIEDPDVLSWRHQSAQGNESLERNDRIHKRWLEEDPAGLAQHLHNRIRTYADTLERILAACTCGAAGH